MNQTTLYELANSIVVKQKKKWFFFRIIYILRVEKKLNILQLCFWMVRKMFWYSKILKEHKEKKK